MFVLNSSNGDVIVAVNVLAAAPATSGVKWPSPLNSDLNFSYEVK